MIVDPALVDDPAALAETLAELLADNADRIEAAIVAATEPVAIAGHVGDDDDAVQTEIDAGKLPGVSMDSAPGVALATDSGISCSMRQRSPSWARSRPTSRSAA